MNTLSPMQQKIVELLKKHPDGLTSEEIAKQLGSSVASEQGGVTA